MDRLDRSEWLPRIIEHVKWTPLEERFQALSKKCKSADPLTLRGAVEERFRESTLGIFLYHLNSVQLQELAVQEDKLAVVLYDLAQEVESLCEFQRRNDLCEDVLAVIKESLSNNPTGKVDLRDVLKHLPVLRLAVSNITAMDKSLAHLAGLKALILSGNCLEDFPGNYLPRGLHYLELFCNCFLDISQLLVDPPPELLYIGLSRNRITGDSLQYLSRLTNLCYLDLEDNNIDNLETIIMILTQVNSIISLVLQGNPCSVCTDYKSIIASSSPHLLFLDGIQLTENDKELRDTHEFEFSGALQVFGIRIIGVPKPAPEKFNKKKVKHTFRLELECPLLDSKLKTWEPKEDSIQEDVITDKPVVIGNTNQSKKFKTKRDAKGNKDVKNTAGKSSKSSGKIKNSKSTKKAKKVLSQRVSESENIFDRMVAEDQTIPGTCPFQSGSMDWGNIIQFPEPCIEVPVEYVDLDLLRNVFRTIITVRLFHMKTVPPDKKKVKPKAKGKQKEKLSSNTELVIDETPKEITVSKTLLAKINLPLHSMCWNLKSLDYTWSKNNPLQAKLSPNVRLLQYALKKKSKKDKNTKDNKINNEDIQEIPLPTVLTCHIGVGVKH